MSMPKAAGGITSIAWIEHTHHCTWDLGSRPSQNDG